MHSIYALYDPREAPAADPRYVGKTSKAIGRRLVEHIRVAKGENKDWRSRWIRSLLEDGVRPEIVAIEENVDDDLASEREAYWIAVLKADGARLTNLTDGGDGTPGRVMTEDERLRVIEMQRDLWADPQHRAERVLAIQQSCSTPEELERRAAQMSSLWSDPTFQEKAREGMRRAWADPEHRQVMADLAAKRWANPTFKVSWLEAYAAAAESQAEGMRQRWQDPEYRALKAAQASAQMIEHWSDPTNRAIMGAKQRKLWEDPAYREMRAAISATHGEKIRQHWQDPAYRANQVEKQTEASRRRMADPVQRQAQADRMRKSAKAWMERWADLPPCPHCGRQIAHPGGRANHIKKCSKSTS